jgi:hypothetical protein
MHTSYFSPLADAVQPPLYRGGMQSAGPGGPIQHSEDFDTLRHRTPTEQDYNPCQEKGMPLTYRPSSIPTPIIPKDFQRLPSIFSLSHSSQCVPSEPKTRKQEGEERTNGQNRELKKGRKCWPHKVLQDEQTYRQN